MVGVPKTAVIYVRISKDRSNETSTATQEAEARELCARRGWTVVSVEKDQGRSAFKADVKRAGLARAMKMIELGTAEVLVVWKLDRLHRGIVDFWETWKRIDGAGGQLASVTDDIDTTRAAGKIMVGLIAGFGEMESEVKSDRAKSWHAGRRADALPPIGPRPFGFQRVDGELVVDEDEARLIKTAAADVLEHRRSLRAIAVEWGTTHRGVRHVLTSPTTSGRREIEGVLIDGGWPAILDPATADRLRAELLDPQRRAGPGSDRRWMLAGFAEQRLRRADRLEAARRRAALLLPHLPQEHRRQAARRPRQRLAAGRCGPSAVGAGPQGGTGASGRHGGTGRPPAGDRRGLRRRPRRP